MLRTWKMLGLYILQAAKCLKWDCRHATWSKLTRSQSQVHNHTSPASVSSMVCISVLFCLLLWWNCLSSATVNPLPVDSLSIVTESALICVCVCVCLSACCCVIVAACICACMRQQQRPCMFLLVRDNVFAHIYVRVPICLCVGAGSLCAAK